MLALKIGQSLCSSNGKVGSLEFIFSVNTATVGSTTSTQFQLPLVSSGTISMDVDWGDGNTDTITAYNQAETLHTYSVAGVYTIEISNEVRGFQFSSGSDRAKLNEISNWGGFNFTKNSSFDECVNMTCTANDTPTIETTNCAYQFLNCTNFNGSVNNWGMSSVTNVQSMFFGCTNFNQPINNWETSSFIDMQNMFQGCSSFDQDVSYWDIRNSTNMFNFMLGVTLSTANYDALLVSWEGTAVVPSGLTPNFGSSKYSLGSAAATARASLVSTYSWTITDGGGI